MASVSEHRLDGNSGLGESTSPFVTAVAMTVSCEEMTILTLSSLGKGSGGSGPQVDRAMRESVLRCSHDSEIRSRMQFNHTACKIHLD